MKKFINAHPIIARLGIDAVLCGLCLVVFALFHHVLPRQQQSLNIVVTNPYAKAESVEAPSNTILDNATEIESDEASANETDEFHPTLYAASSKSTSNTQSSLSGKRSKPSGGASKGGSSIDGESVITETDTPISEKFTEKYSDSAIITDTSYVSSDISIEISRQTSSNGSITYYIADIYLRDITCFQTALAQNTYGSGYRDSISAMAILNDALLAVNGDYYGNTSEGVVIRNGVIYRANPTACDVCVLYYDGSMRVIPGASFSVEDAINDGAWQAWTFGPSLLDSNGGVISSFNSSNRIISANPRTVLGYYEPGHYCLIVVDGRGESSGISLYELSRLCYDLGLQVAYNLDGGNSSIMVWQDEIINTPSGGGRESSDAILIAEAN